MYRLALLIAVAWCLVGSAAMVDESARMKVATLDGTPVYHWRVFKSGIADDVDRALILREFQRKSYKLPPNLVDEAVQRTISEDFGGNSERFTRKLHGDGVSQEEYRQFVAEEITVQAMLYQVEKDPAKRVRKQAAWLANLRANAKVKAVRGSGGKVN